jgi:hypothetical protein
MKMKTSLKVLLLVFLCATACDDQTADFDTVIALKEGKSVTMSDKTVVAIKAVNDSRCPGNANCVWEGRADVVLNVSIGGTDHEVALNEVENASVTLDDYLFEFIELNPYPELNSSDRRSTLKFRISLN